MANFLLPAEVFQIAPQERTDVGEAEELIGLSAALSIHEKTSVYPDTCQKTTKGFMCMQSKSSNKLFYYFSFFNSMFIS